MLGIFPETECQITNTGAEWTKRVGESYLELG